jgi:hypothetical protein
LSATLRLRLAFSLLFVADRFSEDWRRDEKEGPDILSGPSFF